MYHIPRATELSGNISFASTTYSGTSTTATRAPHYDSKELSSTTKAVIGSVTSCLAVAILISEYIVRFECKSFGISLSVGSSGCLFL